MCGGDEVIVGGEAVVVLELLHEVRQWWLL